MARQPLKPLNLLVKLETVQTARGGKLQDNSTSGAESPIHTLSGDFKELSTRRKTPKCRLSLQSADGPLSSDSQLTIEPTTLFSAAVFADSPTPIDSPTILNRQTCLTSSYPHPTLRRFQSSPQLYQSAQLITKSSESWGVSRDGASAPVCGTNTALHDTENSNDSSSTEFHIVEDSMSQDSGIGLEKGFKIPAAVRRRSRIDEISEDACSPHRYSPAKSSTKRPLSFSPLKLDNTDGKTPVQVKRSNSGAAESDDNNFLDFLGLEEADEAQTDGPMSLALSTLLHGALLHGRDSSGSTVSPGPSNLQPAFTLEDSTPVSRRQDPTSRRNLLRSQSEEMQSNELKRTEPPEVLAGPLKRQKGPQGLLPVNKCSPSRLHRSHSASEAQIKLAVHKMTEDCNLIADSSKPHVLPTICGKHQDLKTISSETLVRLMQGEYSDKVEDFYIIDCRYPYEYLGGHIKGAINIHSRAALRKRFFENPLKGKSPSKRFLLVFHCEFSSERGPNLYRYLRDQDRKSNLTCYPRLYYPEVYVLQGGYCDFYKRHKEMCEPQAYIEMVHKDYSKELLKCREKSKSWAGEKSGSSSRGVFRSLKY